MLYITERRYFEDECNEIFYKMACNNPNLMYALFDNFDLIVSKIYNRCKNDLLNCI